MRADDDTVLRVTSERRPRSDAGPAPVLTGSGRGVPLLPLPDPGAAVVVAVRGAQHGVDVERLRGVVVEEDAAVVVELGDEDRGLEAVVEDVAGLGARRSRRTRSRRRCVAISRIRAARGPVGQQADELLGDRQRELAAPSAGISATRTPSNGMTRLSWNAPARCRSSPGCTRPGGMAGSTICS